MRQMQSTRHLSPGRLHLISWDLCLEGKRLPVDTVNLGSMTVPPNPGKAGAGNWLPLGHCLGIWVTGGQMPEAATYF